MKLSIVLALAALSSSAQSFVPASVQQGERPTTQLQASAPGAARFFGAIAAASIFSLSAQEASASNTPAMPFASSSIEIAEEIKQLDMSLPSYGDIKDSKASVSNVKSLSVDNKGKPVGIITKSRNYPSAAPVEAPKPAAVETKKTSASLTYDF